MSNIGWSFPENHGGEERGLNNAGIETFSGKKVESLAREIIQNSMDARIDNDKPVRVSFDLIQVKSNDIPHVKEYEEILTSCYRYWERNEKASSFFTKSLAMLQQDKIPVLKISDYNTSGLTGAQLERGGHFHSLIKSEGVSDKAEGKGGSFGIGKNAPFATSALRTVYYSSVDRDNITAVQGVAKLVTHLNKEDNTTQGTGYFGVLDGNKPILDKELFPNFIQKHDRTLHGTDIFVLGFCEEESWEVTILKNVVENFLVAIYNGDLEISIDNLEVNVGTLESYISQYLMDEKGYDAYYYYQALKRGLRFKETFPELGEVELYLILKENAPKKIAMMRATGMIIERYNPRSVPKDYAAIFIGTGDKLNGLLRKMENPEHTAWEAERIDDKKERTKARKALTTLKKWIRNMIFDQIIPEETETIEVDFIGDFLPDDTDEFSLANNQRTGDSGEVKIEEGEFNKQTAAIYGNSLSGFEDEDSDERLTSTPGSKSNNRNGKHTGKGKGTEQNASRKQQRLKYARSIFNQNKNKYELIMEADKDKTGFIKLFILGDDGKTIVHAKQAELVGNKLFTKKVPVNDGKIGPVKFSANKRIRIAVQLEYSYRAALEVNFYES